MTIGCEMKKTLCFENMITASPRTSTRTRTKRTTLVALGDLLVALGDPIPGPKMKEPHCGLFSGEVTNVATSSSCLGGPLASCTASNCCSLPLIVSANVKGDTIDTLLREPIAIVPGCSFWLRSLAVEHQLSWSVKSRHRCHGRRHLLQWLNSVKTSSPFIIGPRVSWTEKVRSLWDHVDFG